MWDWDEQWNISLAGCGFRSVYYLGALSCILQQVPRLIHGAAKICGASSGCLVAAALTVGIPIEQLCADVLTVAKEARRHSLGVFHPTFSLLQEVHVSLLQKLPADAHVRASGRLCVSLTRMKDGKNLLVSEFSSREELIQVLMCSCFFPVYCGFIPPSYRGELYMDGALSNNLPLSELRNTITMAPFSGESDICPSEGTFNFLEVHYGNVSIQVNAGNVHRVCTSFLPPRIENLAVICHNGYMDALRFLKQRDLLRSQESPPSLDSAPSSQKPNLHDGNHRWLDLKLIQNLPVSLNTVLCEACRDCEESSSFLPLRVLLFFLSLLLMSLQLSISLSSRFVLLSLVLSGCSILLRLLTSTAHLCRQRWSSQEPHRVLVQQSCRSSSTRTRHNSHRPPKSTKLL